MWVVGDPHGKFESLKRLIKFSGIKKEAVILAGDCGVGFQPPPKEKRILEDLNKFCLTRKVMLYLVRGNHDDPAYWNSSQEFTNLKFVGFGEPHQIEGHNMLFIGGATSIDRTARKEGISYWKDEVLDDLHTVYEGIDIVVSHTAPYGTVPFHISPLVYSWAKDDKFLLQDLHEERIRLTDYKDKLEAVNTIKRWVYGHFHMSATYGQYVALNELEFYNINQKI